MILLAAGELAIIAACFYLGHYTRLGNLEAVQPQLVGALTFAFIMVACMIAMGVYESRIREGMTGMILRTAVAVFLLGAAAMAILIYVFPVLEIGRGVLLIVSIEAFAAVNIFRWIVFAFMDESRFKTRVLVLGTGHRAVKIASRMRRRADQRAFKLLGFLDPHHAASSNQTVNGSASANGSDVISAYGATIIRTDLTLPEYCEHNDVEEIVVAMDERRRNLDAVGGLPLDELLECRLRGIQICDVQQFIEREAGKLDVDLLRPSWMVFSDGFIVGSWRVLSKRLFDLLASSLLLLVAWPIMLVTCLCIFLEDGFRSPVFYRQTRIGLNGKPFDVIKFRSMREDAEKSGQAVWATRNDTRVTRVGAIIRKSRIDELPQLFNVLKGDMSFVGPRPERPMFVEELTEKIPFYSERHRVKPGITGWAQLCYPYGASVEDAKEKLQYDLYYLKNNSLLLDMVILLQTVEVVLVGEGAR
jgi:sugar transferase (PEP-CTERM system associated)